MFGSKDHLKICKDENFWMRKIQRDYSNFRWKDSQYASWLTLYKILTLRYGALYNFNTQELVVDYLVKKIIVSNCLRTYVIDSNNNLIMIRYGGYSGNYLDMYLADAFDLSVEMTTQRDGNSHEDEVDEDDLEVDEKEPEKIVILLKNIKDLVMDWDSGLLLTMNGNVYEIGNVEMRVPLEIEGHVVRGTRNDLIKIADNVNEIGTCDKYSCYITRDNKLYVRTNGKNFSERKRAPFKFVEQVTALYGNGDNFYYVDHNNHCCKNFIGPTIDAKQTINQLLVCDHVWYFIRDDNVLAEFDEETEIGSVFSGEYDKIFTRPNNDGKTIVYVVSSNFSLFRLNRQENNVILTHVDNNVVSIYNDYYIRLPLSENFALNVKPMREF